MNSRRIGSCDSKLRILHPMENIGSIWQKTMAKLHCPFLLFLNWSQKKTVPITKLFTIHLPHFGYLMDRSWRTFHFPKNKLDESHSQLAQTMCCFQFLARGVNRAAHRFDWRVH